MAVLDKEFPSSNEVAASRDLNSTVAFDWLISYTDASHTIDGLNSVQFEVCVPCSRKNRFFRRK